MAEDPRALLCTGQKLGQTLSLTRRYFGSVSGYLHGWEFQSLHISSDSTLSS